MTLSVVCPLCEQRATNFVCARCALTTAEERDTAQAEVARLTVERKRLRAALSLATEAVPKEYVWDEGQMTYFDAFCAALGILKPDRFDAATETVREPVPGEGESESARHLEAANDVLRRLGSDLGVAHEEVDTVVKERDAARAEVARLTAIVDLVASIKAEHDQASMGWSGKESDRHWGDLFDAIDAYRVATQGATDAAT